MNDIKRKPPWLKVKLPCGSDFNRVKEIISSLHLHSVCQEARCPNLTECFSAGTATFLILGNICTRNCRYCNVHYGAPEKVDASEPERLVQAVKELGLAYIVITSVTRDDLPDGGADIFARSIEGLREEIAACKVEVLIPDLMGNGDALARIMEANPHVINHNMEVVPSLFKDLRPQGDYRRSLELLKRVSLYGGNRVAVKSGFMVGFGEKWDDIGALLDDLASVQCKGVTIGQYQQPTKNHWPVMKYYEPEEFEAIGDMACNRGLKYVTAGALVRSSYHAANMMPL